LETTVSFPLLAKRIFSLFADKRLTCPEHPGWMVRTLPVQMDLTVGNRGFLSSDYSIEEPSGSQLNLASLVIRRLGAQPPVLIA